MTRVWYAEYFVIDKDDIFSTCEKWLFKHMDVSTYGIAVTMARYKMRLKKLKCFDNTRSTSLPIKYAIPTGIMVVAPRYNSKVNS